VHEITIVIEDSAVAEDDVVSRVSLELPADLGVEDPLLSCDRGFLVDGQGTAPGYLADHFQIGVAAFEGSGEFKAESRLADPVTTN
jgi:hypothetical protein